MHKYKLFLFCITGLMAVYGLDLSYAGVVLVDTSSMTAEEVAQMRTETLERTKAKIDYCLANLGKNINEVDLKQVGDNDANLCVITYGLIAQKYYRPYNDIGKAADYYYLEWKHTHGSECGSPDETGKIIIDCAGKDKGCVWPFGEYNPFSEALGAWKEAGQYKKAAKHYKEYFDNWVNNFDGNTYQEKFGALNNWRNSHPDHETDYQNVMKEWNDIKELAKTEKPQLEPSVQHHEWFYSGKTSEVLKALDYYNTNKVKFMVEKAAKHKSPVVAKKARAYLDNWYKPIPENKKEAQPKTKAK